MLTLRYEDVVTQPVETASRLAEFLGVPADPFLPGWEERATVRALPAWGDGLVATHAVSIGRWKREAGAAERAANLMRHPEAAGLLEALGYVV